MSVEYESLLFQAVITVGAIGFMVRLLQLKVDGSKRKAVLNKYKVNTKANAQYGRVYGAQFMYAWVLVTFSLVLDLLFSLYKQSHGHISVVLQTFVFIVQVLISAEVLYLLYIIFRKSE